MADGRALFLRAQFKTSVLDVRLTYKAQQAPLAKALKDIRTLTNVRFTYNADIIRRQPPVTIDAKQVTLEAVLKQILSGTKLQFAEDLGGIVIFPDEDAGEKTGKRSILVTGQVGERTIQTCRALPFVHPSLISEPLLPETACFP